MKNVLKKIYKYSIIFVVCYTLLLLIFTLINHFTHDNFFCLAEYSAKSIIDYITLYLFYFDNIFIIICFILLVFYIFYFIYSIVKKKGKLILKFFSIGLPIISIMVVNYCNLLCFAGCMITYKPMIYLYPNEDNTNITIKLGNSNLLTTTYPKYNDSWNVVANSDGNLYDLNTNRYYYGLYWEGIDNSEINLNEGFVIKGSESSKFLEDKLSYLGLNGREINEFIVYWLPKLESNKYNYIRFRTIDEINKYMPIESNYSFDTTIRVIMDFKGLNRRIKVDEQRLTKVERTGSTLVEWGGREI